LFFSEYLGYGVRQNLIEGHKKMHKVFLSGDSYWTFCYACSVYYGNYGFQMNQIYGKLIYKLSKNQPISNFSLFEPWCEYRQYKAIFSSS
jgi:hypothetical protein